MWIWYKSMLTKHPLATKATTSCIIMSMSDVAVQYMEQQQSEQENQSEECINEKSKSTHSPLSAASHEMDLTDQTTRSELFQWDVSRTVHVGITGLTFTGPLAHGWYKVLDQVVRTKSKAMGVPIRMMLDALLFSPVAVGGYFVWRCVLQDEALVDLVDIARTQVVGVVPNGGGSSSSSGDNEGGSGLVVDRMSQSIQTVRHNVYTTLEHKFIPGLVGSWTFWPAANIINYGFVPTPYRVLYINCLGFLWMSYLTHLNHQPIPAPLQQESLLNDKTNSTTTATSPSSSSGSSIPNLLELFKNQLKDQFETTVAAIQPPK